MDPHSVVPSSKFDIEAANRAVALGWPGVEPVIAELLEWIQDLNWPAGQALMPLLTSIGAPLTPHLYPILNGDDDQWKYWVIVALLPESPPSLLDEFTLLLQRIADRPSASERAADLDEVAAATLGRTL